MKIVESIDPRKIKKIIKKINECMNTLFKLNIYKTEKINEYGCVSLFINKFGI